MKRLIHTTNPCGVRGSPTQVRATVHYTDDLDEFCVRLQFDLSGRGIWVAGYPHGKPYITEDRDDALATANAMVAQFAKSLGTPR